MDMRRTQGVSGVAVLETSTECGDWRSQLQADSRQRIINKIMDTLKRHIPFRGHEGLQELKKIAVRFEENIYTAATSRSDYMRKIYLKMLTMETRSQNPVPDALQSNFGANSLKASEELYTKNMIFVGIGDGHVVSTMEGSSSLSSLLPPGTGLPQSTISNVDGQNSSLQNIQDMSRVQQREASSNSTAQMGNPDGGDWQEDVYQQIKAMKDLYLLDLNDLHQKVLGKLQPHDSLPNQLTNEHLEKLKAFKTMLERFMAFLQIPKHNILPNYKDKLSFYEKQIVQIISSNRPKPGPLPPPHKHSTHQSQQTHSTSPLLSEFTSHNGVVASLGSRKCIENVGLRDHHTFASKFLFFMECFFIFLFICYMGIVLMYVLIA